MDDLVLGPVGAGSSGKNAVRPGVHRGKRFMDQPGREQMTLLVRCVDDMVAADAYVRVLDELMEEFDYSALEATYPGGGRPAYPPRLLCGLWVYAFTVGVRSARELSRRLCSDLNFMWLAREQRIDHETLSQFRRRVGSALKTLFKQTVQVGMASGLVPLEHVAVDGTKVAANAMRQMKDREQLERALSRVDEKIDEMLKEADALDDAEDAALGKLRGDEVPEELRRAEGRRERLRAAKKRLEEEGLSQLSETDLDARLMKTPEGKRAGYNCQVAVDAGTGFIVAEQTTVSQNDRGEFMGVAQEVVETVGRVPWEFSADSGYHSPETLEGLEERSDWNAYISPQRRSRAQEERLSWEDFEYEAAADAYHCPGGDVLWFQKEVVLRGVVWRQYRSGRWECGSCAYRERCAGDEGRRVMLVAPHSMLVAKMRGKASSEAGTAARELRKSTVERVFGVMKSVMGLRQFLLRGLARASVEFRLASIATNVGKLVRYRLGGLGSPA